MKFLGRVVFLSSVILLLGRHTEAKGTSALLYNEEDNHDSILHRLELNSSCIKCLFDCGKYCLRDKPLRFNYTDVDIGPVDFLYEESKVFFFNKRSRRIESIRFSATSSTSRVTEHELCSNSVHGIAVDWIGKNLYYTDVIKKAIVVTSLKASASRLLVHKDLLRPYGVAVDASRGNVCWTDVGKRMVECLQLSDMNRATVYYDLEEPTAITIDSNTGHVYWADKGRATIYRAKTDGSDFKKVYYDNDHRFYGLTFVEDTIFTISQAASSSGNIHMYDTASDKRYLYSLKAKVSSIKDLTFYDERRQSQTGKCSDVLACRGGMCVMTGKNNSGCLCPAGKKPRGESCVDSDDFPPLCFVYAVGNAICSDHVLQVQETSRSDTSGCFRRSPGEVSALCVHSSSKTVYFYLSGTSSIRSRRLDKQSTSKIKIRSSGDVTGEEQNYASML